MELKEYLFKFFRFNRNSDKPFAYTFFPISRYKIIDINTKKIMEILYEISDTYYEYSFDTDKITIFNEFIFNEDKCIISKDLSLGIFYDFNKNEIYFFNDVLLRALPFEETEIKKLGITRNSNKKDIVEKFYTSRISNATKDFEHLIHCFIINPMAAGRGDYIPSAFDGLTKEEREVFMDIIIDLGSYNSSLFDASDYFNEDKMTQYIKLMNECPNIPSHAKKNIIFKLYPRTKAITNLIEVKILLRNEFSFFSSGLKYFVSADDELFKILAKESLMSEHEDMRKMAFDIVVERNCHKKITNYRKMMDIYKHILNNKDNNYEGFVDELLSLNEINDEIATKLVDEYGDVLYLDKILEICKDANNFTLRRSWDEITVDGHNEWLENKDNDCFINEKYLKEKYPNFDEIYNEFYIITDKMFADHFYDNTLDFGNENIQKIYNRLDFSNPIYNHVYHKIYDKYYSNLSIKRYNMPIEIGIEELDSNMLDMKRVQKFRKYEWPKIREYKFKLNEETKNWLINKRRIIYGDELIDLHIYKDDKLLYKSGTESDIEEFYILNKNNLKQR